MIYCTAYFPLLFLQKGTGWLSTLCRKLLPGGRRNSRGRRCCVRWDCRFVRSMYSTNLVTYCTAEDVLTVVTYVYIIKVTFSYAIIAFHYLDADNLYFSEIKKNKSIFSCTIANIFCRLSWVCRVPKVLCVLCGQAAKDIGKKELA